MRGWFWFILIVSLLLLVFGMRKTHAHMHDRPDLNGWAHDLRSTSGIPCCDSKEAEPLRDPDWRVSAEGHYEVFIDGEWITVPDSAVVKGPNLYGQTLVWYTHWPALSVYIRCFLPAAGT